MKWEKKNTGKYIGMLEHLFGKEYVFYWQQSQYLNLVI